MLQIIAAILGYPGPLSFSAAQNDVKDDLRPQMKEDRQLTASSAPKCRKARSACAVKAYEYT